MKPVVIYTQPLCGFCTRAKSLLSKKGVDFTEINTFLTRGARAEMMERSGGRRTVPQIFIGEVHVGGCDDLFALEKAGKLDPLLQS